MAEEEDDPPDLFGDEGTDADADADGGDERADAPLDDLAREVREKRAARESGADVDADAVVDSDLFESVEVDHVDDDAVWESFVEGETGPEERVGLGADAEQAADPAEHVVPKRDFCQRCPHFTDPPEVACTHEGTDIVEAVDADRFRVRNCPVVEEEDAVPRE
jgi:hypothetical protein